MRFQYQCILSIRLACRSFALIAAAENQVNLPRRRAKRADLFRKNVNYDTGTQCALVKWSPLFLSLSLHFSLNKENQTVFPFGSIRKTGSIIDCDVTPKKYWKITTFCVYHHNFTCRVYIVDKSKSHQIKTHENSQKGPSFVATLILYLEILAFNFYR